MNNNTLSPNENNSRKPIAVKSENPSAQLYLDHLLNEGCNEGDSGNEMELPSYYNDKLFRK